MHPFLKLPLDAKSSITPLLLNSSLNRADLPRGRGEEDEWFYFELRILFGNKLWSHNLLLDGFEFKKPTNQTAYERWYLPEGSVGLIESSFNRNRAPIKREYQVKASGWCIAALNGDLTAVKDLVKSYNARGGVLDIDFGVCEDGMSALHFAAAGGHRSVCEFLLGISNLDINLKDREAGEAPLHLAILEGHLETAVWLLEHGADPNVKNIMGWTPLHYAVEQESTNLIPLLLSKGAEINAIAECGAALQLAARESNQHIVELLLENNADPNECYDNCSPLMASTHAHSIECLKLMLKAGADPNFRGSKGMTPLAYAAMEGSAEFIKCLLEAGADPIATNDFRVTPIEEAVLRGRRWAAKILYPVTAPIPTIYIGEWNIDGLFKRVICCDAWHTRMGRGEIHYFRLKTEGNKCVKRNDYLGAVEHYTKAMAYYSFDIDLRSNRSLCWAKLNKGELALEDAKACVELDREWPEILNLSLTFLLQEAHYREGCALMLLKKYEDAVDSFRLASMLDDDNEELWRACFEAKKACKAERKKKLLQGCQNQVIVRTGQENIRRKRHFSQTTRSN